MSATSTDHTLLKPTVRDLAREADVSLATVDRVLNDRPGVRAVTRAKVMDAIERIGFVRDMAAANLAKSRVYPLSFLVPASDNSFLIGLKAQIAEAAAHLRKERVEISVRDVPPFDPLSLANAIHAEIDRGISGIALVANDDPQVIAAVNAASDKGIPVVTLVSDLPESRRVHFAGIDNHAAGRTAASLLGRFAGPVRGEIVVLTGSMLVRDHRERLAGFRAGLEAHFPDLQIGTVLEGRDDPLLAEGLVFEALSTGRRVVGIYSLGAGNRGLVRALARSGKPGPVIAHELTETTRLALEEGVIDALLNQDAGHEVRSAIRVLKATVDGQRVIAAQERIRIDIFLKDNLP